MFNSKLPLNADPRYRDNHHTWLVAVCAADFCDLYGTDRANEYFAAGQAKLAEFLDDDGLLTKPIPYVRKSIKNAILKNWQTDRQLKIPPSTRWDMVNRGDDPPDHTRHSWGDVFDNNGVRDGFDEHEEVDPMSKPRWGKPSSEPARPDNVPHCANSEEQWLAPECRYKQWSEILETLEVIYSLCRDDFDRTIVEARLDGFASIDDAPVHVDEVAAQLGISSYEVQERLDRLERRYCKLLNRTLPTNRQTQRATAP